MPDSLDDLRDVWIQDVYGFALATLADVLTRLSDADLIGELVKRGVLQETKNDLGQFLFYALRQPVGSGE